MTIANGPRDGLLDKRALITGAGTGIGKSIAIALAESGCRLALHHRSNGEGARDVARLAGRLGCEAKLYEADLSERSAPARLAAAVMDDFGGIDILVSSAGWTLETSIATTTDALLDEVLAVNLRAPYILIRECTPYLAQSRGNVLAISSIHAKLGAPGYSAYAATKGGIAALVAALAVELAPDGIRVNGIAPGLVEVERLLEDRNYDSKHSSRAIPLRRPGTPRDIAELARFMVSSSATWLTGEVVTLDGGTSALMPLAVPTGDK